MSFVPANDVVSTVFSGKYAAKETTSALFLAPFIGTD
jgi:butyrate kinase